MYLQKLRYGNAKKSEYNGYYYQSAFEAGYAKELDLRMKAGDILSWERQVKIPLIFNGFLIANYYIDFKIYHKDKTIEFVELKGYPVTEVWKMKWRIMEALYSGTLDVKLTLIKMANNFNLRKLKKVK